MHGKYNKFTKERTDEQRTNFQIRVPSVRVVHDERQLGIMPTEQARKLAQEYNLDLVEVVPHAHPPVCRIMDYGRFKYDQQLKKKEAAKKQRESQVQLKELRLRPVSAEHDTLTKVNQARKFLEDGNKVLFTCVFRGKREMCHRDQGFAVMNLVVKSLEDIAAPESPLKMEGSKLICCLVPKV